MNFLRDKILLYFILLLSGLLMINCPKHQDNIIEKASYILMYNKYQEINYQDATGCGGRNGNNIPYEYEFDISTPQNKLCGYAYDQTKSTYEVILDYNTKLKVNPIEVSAGVKLVCRCPELNQPLTGETQWYKRNNSTDYKATLFFTHTYQKDVNGNITGVDPFIPTASGDTFYCLLSICGKAYKGAAFILKIK